MFEQRGYKNVLSLRLNIPPAESCNRLDQKNNGAPTLKSVGLKQPLVFRMLKDWD